MYFLLVALMCVAVSAMVSSCEPETIPEDDVVKTDDDDEQNQDEENQNDENSGEENQEENNEENQEENQEDNQGGGDDEETNSANLSANGTANCYLISAAGTYYFNATVKGNGAVTEGLDEDVSLSGASAGLVWQSSTGMISEVALNENGEIEFTVAKEGNAVVALKDEDGTILWSWHIWFPIDQPQDLYCDSGYYVLDMNLGALKNDVANVRSYGMLYQWGRKDPFPSSGTLTGDTSTVSATCYDADGNEISFPNSYYPAASMSVAIANPTICYGSYANYSASHDWTYDSNDAYWGNPSGSTRGDDNTYSKGEKTIYDPSPVGYRVPPIDVFSHLTTSGGISYSPEDWAITDLNEDGEISSDDFYYGFEFTLSEGVTSYFPAAGRVYGCYGMLYGSVCGLYCNYWGNAPYSSSYYSGYGYAVLAFQNISVSPAAGGDRSDAYSIRCVKE